MNDKTIAQLIIKDFISNNQELAECEINGTSEDIADALYSIITNAEADKNHRLYHILRDTMIELLLTKHEFAMDFWTHLKAETEGNDTPIIPLNLN